ncbi:hypothetical protein HOS13_gp07 [Caulobacter phage Lullwater]|uniref:Uncharacterized protein n=1 Tax=Caulobacter phage Lullwater TaxID=2024607 RepID=A0A291LB13_9CAUD|nr:hypothetical protein HOS13_gp07 [Caulobacter phage Lullwater]ATI16314.1 hypothetical protein Lull_007 [Caulobacter phage Lullwater]
MLETLDTYLRCKEARAKKQPGRLTQALDGALLLLEDRRNWTKGAYARTKSGGGCFIKDKTAACFCIAGAVAKADQVVRNDTESDVLVIERLLWNAAVDAGALDPVVWPSIALFNDHAMRKHEEVVTMLKKTLRHAKKHGL